ncbi:uncharacterized protein LOC111248591 isoform X2 [Varroa destructor]|uniref:Uncharacterized protein n=1 Tax=Varroa destructor TaxID=109461 RepID=A0A7M7JTA1_VARDE|nr:uncharacterized protein LOC111248591 isoform X2 [Varroa destructor]
MIVDLLSGVGVSRHIGQTCCHNFVRRVSIHSQKVNRKCEERCSFNMRSINSQESLSDADVGLCNNENHIDPEVKQYMFAYRLQEDLGSRRLYSELPTVKAVRQKASAA